MSERRVGITGLGMVSPFGGTTQDFFSRMLAGESAIGFFERDEKPRPFAIPAVRCDAFDPDASLGRGQSHEADLRPHGDSDHWRGAATVAVGT